MKRREFMGALSGALAMPWLSRSGYAQERVRRVGVLMTLAEDDPLSRQRLAAFAEILQQRGWADGRNLRIEYRWGGGNSERLRRSASELIAVAPEVIMTTGSVGLSVLLNMTRTIPVVFTIVPDPVGEGFVETLARPGGNATGFTQFEYGITGKWLDLLKEVAPVVTRVAVLREPSLPAAVAQFAALQAVAPARQVDLVPLNVRNAADIERTIAGFARSATDGLVVTSSPLTAIQRELIVAVAARHKIPAVYYTTYFVAAGGLIGYGPDFVDQYSQAGEYVDRILRGEKPGDLPVQNPIRYELAVNVKTARTLGLTVPPTLLARADVVIE